MVGNQAEHVEWPQARRRPLSNVIFTLSFNRFIRHQVRSVFRCFFRLTGSGVLKADLCQQSFGDGIKLRMSCIAPGTVRGNKGNGRYLIGTCQMP